jgi:hypothetical protein
MPSPSSFMKPTLDTSFEKDLLKLGLFLGGEATGESSLSLPPNNKSSSSSYFYELNRSTLE